MKILSPACARRHQTIPIAPRKKGLDGEAWGFVDTSKVNADLFIEEMKAEIQRLYQPKRFTVIRKEAPGFPLTPAQLERLDAECSFVVFCFGD